MPPDRLTARDLARIAEEHFRQPVERITAPGGRSRDSLRLVFADRTVFATQRKNSGRFRTERTILETLGKAGAPVPAFLGERGGLLFQEDAGDTRLTAELARLPRDEARERVASAFAALWELKDAADAAGLTPRLPVLSMNERFLTSFCATPARLSRALEIAAPSLDAAALAQTVVVQPKVFVKWDARPGNAAVRPDGRTIWFDWEYAGRRGGVEDFAFLAGDEYWVFPADPTLELLALSDRRVTPGMLRLFVVFTVLHMAQRLRLILDRVRLAGWGDAEAVMRYDRIGTVPDLVQRLCANGADLAGRDQLTRPMVDWFGRMSEAIVKERQRTRPATEQPG